MLSPRPPLELVALTRTLCSYVARSLSQGEMRRRIPAEVQRRFQVGGAAAGTGRVLSVGGGVQMRS